MAIVRLELEIPEVRDLVALIGKVERGSSLYRAKRELQRGLERGEAVEAHEREQVRKMRANRRVPSFGEEPLTPQTMSRRRSPLE